MTFLFGNILNKIETIEQLENQLEHKSFQIDSLKHEIDTLQWENQIWDFNLSNNTVHLLSAIIHGKILGREEGRAHEEARVGSVTA